MKIKLFKFKFLISLILIIIIVPFIIEIISYLVLEFGQKGFYNYENGNEFGIRENRKKDEFIGKDVILVIGDQFTYGCGVKKSDTYPYLLENKFKNHMKNDSIMVVNAGMNQYDTEMEYEMLKKIFDIYNPRVVIIAFHSEDIVQNNTVIKMEKEDFNIINRKKTQPLPFRIRKFLRDKTYFGKILIFLYKNYLIKYIPPPQSMMSMKAEGDYEKEFFASKYYLDKIYKYLKEKDSNMILVSMVPLVRFDVFPYHHVNKTLEKYAREKKIGFINSLDAFSKYNSSELWVSLSHGHYSPKANFILAESLLNYLLDEYIR